MLKILNQMLQIRREFFGSKDFKGQAVVSVEPTELDEELSFLEAINGFCERGIMFEDAYLNARAIKVVKRIIKKLQ